MGSITSGPDSITVVAGQPLNRQIRAVGVKDVWPTLDAFELRAQLRTGSGTSARLIANLHDYMTKVFDGDDLVITWTMSGAQTRTLYGKVWGLFKTGYFNIILSDPGDEDAKALIVPLVSVRGVDTTTTAEGSV